MAKTLFEMLSGGVSPAEQRQNTKEESEPIDKTELAKEEKKTKDPIKKK